MKLWSKQENTAKGDTINDLEAIEEFLQGAKNDLSLLRPQLEKLAELEKERHIANPGLLQVNLETQAQLFDQLLQRYEFFQNDVDINGLRLKQIAERFLQHAEKAGMKDLVQDKKSKPQWTFPW